MKRWVSFLITAAVLFFLPKGQGQDVGKLEPVELICIQEENDRIQIETDTGEKGGGNTLQEALQDTQDTAVGKIFLETVDYVLVTEQTKSVIGQLKGILRPSVNLILVTGPVELEGLALFLKTHKPDATLKDWLTGKQKLPKLMVAGERYYLV